MQQNVGLNSQVFATAACRCIFRPLLRVTIFEFNRDVREALKLAATVDRFMIDSAVSVQYTSYYFYYYYH